MKFLLLTFTFLISFYCKAQDAARFAYRPGDLLFQDLDCGDLCNAIETVTPALGDKRFSHVGMVYLQGDSVYVLEAIGKGVQLTPLHRFLKRQLDSAGQPKIVVGRLKTPYRHLTPAALQFALSRQGADYDKAFLANNGKYYCSELVSNAYRAANKNKAFFPLHPMTFKDPATGQFFPAWVSYYLELGMAIPEGSPGCNPGSLANDEKLEIVVSFY